jgi:hypothetical protein
MTAYVNFGQRPWQQTPPSGFKALCTQNLPDPTIADGGDYFNTVLYTGNGFATAGTQTISGVGFQPDFVWIKSRSAAGSNHSLYDAVRTAGNTLISNSTAAETSQTDSLTAFTSDGFSLGDNSESGANVNVNTATYVAWNWNAGGSNATNTDGTITSTVRANPTAGFSIVSYTGVDTPSTNTVGHGLGVTPKIWLIKNRSQTSPAGWIFNTTLIDGSVDYLILNSTAAKADQGSPWNTLPTSTVFTLGANDVNTCNAGDSYIAYCFAEVEGYSKFGSYTGNGDANGPFVYCGFRPAFIFVKRTDAVLGWGVYDTARNTFNAFDKTLVINTSDAEATTIIGDILSNGFKFRYSGAQNASGGTYIFAAFAESPFKYSLAR